MNNIYYYLLGFSFPFLMNALGAFFIYFTPSVKYSAFLKGVSAGIITSACIWSLLIPSINLSEELGVFNFLPACVGILLGSSLIYLSDGILNVKKSSGNFRKIFWAIFLHNIPEGLAVGFAFGLNGANLKSALAVSFGIGIQNAPEGYAVSLCATNYKKSKKTAVSLGVLSGAIEPVSALIGALLVGFLSFLQPWILAFSAGVMLFVVAQELIPECAKVKGGVWGFITGFCFMMALDLIFA